MRHKSEANTTKEIKKNVRRVFAFPLALFSFLSNPLVFPMNLVVPRLCNFPHQSPFPAHRCHPHLPHPPSHLYTFATNPSIQSHHRLREDGLQQFDVCRSEKNFRQDDSLKRQRARRPLSQHTHQHCHLSDQQSALKDQKHLKMREDAVPQACNQGEGSALCVHRGLTLLVAAHVAFLEDQCLQRASPMPALSKPIYQVSHERPGEIYFHKFQRRDACQPPRAKR